MILITVESEAITFRDPIFKEMVNITYSLSEKIISLDKELSSINQEASNNLISYNENNNKIIELLSKRKESFLHGKDSIIDISVAGISKSNLKNKFNENDPFESVELTLVLIFSMVLVSLIDQQITTINKYFPINYKKIEDVGNVLNKEKIKELEIKELDNNLLFFHRKISSLLKDGRLNLNLKVDYAGYEIDCLTLKEKDVVEICDLRNTFHEMSLLLTLILLEETLKGKYIKNLMKDKNDMTDIFISIATVCEIEMAKRFYESKKKVFKI